MMITKTTLVMGLVTASALAGTAMISTSLAVICLLVVGLVLTLDAEMLKDAFEDA